MARYCSGYHQAQSKLCCFSTTGYIRILRTDDDDNLCQTDLDPLVGIACALDDNGNKVDVTPPKVCGTSAILFDVSYPTGAYKIE